MNNEKTISIKEEQLDVMCADPSTMFLDDPLGVFWSTDCIKKDVRLNFGWDEKENNNPAVSTLLQAILEAEREFCPPPILVPKKERFAENTLGLSWITDFIKEEPELDLEADETENIVVFSTRTAFNGTRLIQKSGEICGISFEENVNKGGIQNNPESTQYTMFSTDISGLKEKEEEEGGGGGGGGGGSLFETTLNCSLKEREFHKFICSFCLQIFHSKYRLIKHVFIHISGVQSPMYVCKSCGEVFSSNITMNKHLRMSDNYDVGGGNRGCDNASENRIFLEEDRKVPIYEKIEDQSSSIETRKNCKNERTGMTPIAEKLIGTDSKGRKKIYKFDVCERSFSRPDHLSNHALTHSEAWPHKCGKCGKSYNVFLFIQETYVQTHW